MGLSGGSSEDTLFNKERCGWAPCSHKGNQWSRGHMVTDKGILRREIDMEVLRVQGNMELGVLSWKQNARLCGLILLWEINYVLFSIFHSWTTHTGGKFQIRATS